MLLEMLDHYSISVDKMLGYVRGQVAFKTKLLTDLSEKTLKTDAHFMVGVAS